MSNNTYKKADFWTQRARKEGYPARSVYKLEEILKKHPAVLSAKKNSKPLNVLELGAAPGSWSLYLLRKFGKSLKLKSCDLLPLSKEFGKSFFEAENFFFIQGDFTDTAIKTALCEKGAFDALFSDAAPSTTGSRLVDTARSFELAEETLFYAEEALAVGGSMVLKLFQGEGSLDFSRRAEPLFEKSRFFKPEASRAESFETFFIGTGKKGAVFS